MVLVPQYLMTVSVTLASTGPLILADLGRFDTATGLKMTITC